MLPGSHSSRKLQAPMPPAVTQWDLKSTIISDTDFSFAWVNPIRCREELIPFCGSELHLLVPQAQSAPTFIARELRKMSFTPCGLGTMGVSATTLGVTCSCPSGSKNFPPYTSCHWDYDSCCHKSPSTVSTWCCGSWRPLEAKLPTSRTLKVWMVVLLINTVDSN
jgi:hypothetical protein